MADAGLRRPPRGRTLQARGQRGRRRAQLHTAHRLSITWEYGGQISWVDVELTAVDDGTRLLLEHTAPVDPENWEQYGPGAVGIGWEMALWGLDEHLALTRRRPCRDRGWMTRPEGRAYWSS